MSVDLEKKILEHGGSPDILVLSAVHIKGSRAEADYYVEALKKLGAQNVSIERRGFDTIGQLQIAKAIAAEKKADLIIISTATHYLRVRWLCITEAVKAKHYITSGIPRPREAITDIILTFLFPIIDILGLRKKYLALISTRRKSGKF
ncbi:MAG: YdcF family protein [Candidatus Taylorbacteria bacterium]|nr:YdcF family protein [Candidatus Taylorbacteria bacterium]